jgi:2-polyprenyl-3-methyl-5-hydroxy-6-metoxy-1,4-benzoquinol methylase
MPIKCRVDSISGHPLPVLIVRGWCTDPAHVEVELECQDGTRHAPSLLCREPRPDVVAAQRLTFPWPGFIAEFHLVNRPKSVRVFGARHVVEEADRYCTAEPHYKALYQTDHVLHRQDIYGSGPPVPANPTIVDLSAALLGASILDFGCGSGDLVAKLRALGRDAIGIEIDRPAIREHQSADAAQFVKLYDGSLPLPYPDKAFDSVIATEVIEHVDDPRAVANELMRVCRTSILITVPDMSSIPFSWPTNTVPWHLLESTHVNFFIARSLGSLFSAGYKPSRLFSLYSSMLDQHFIPGSIAILFARTE